MFRTSIRNKLMGLLLAATIIPILISMFVSDRYIKHAVTDKSILENRAMLSLGKDNILNYMNTINRISLNVYNSMNTPTSLHAIIERATAPGANAQTFDSNNRMQIYTHLLNMYQSMKEIHQIHLQIKGADHLSYLLSRGLFRGGPESGISWPASRMNDSRPFVEATHESVNYELDWSRKVKQESVFTLRRPIIRSPSDEILAYLTIDIQSQQLSDICQSLAPSGQETLYLLDRSRHVVCSANASGSAPGGLLAAPWADRLFASSEPSGFIRWKDSAFSGIVIYDTLQTNYMDWIVVKQLPYSYLYENARTIRTINSLIIALFLVIVVAATLVVSFHFTKPIKRLISHINKAQTGNLDVAVPVQGRDEIGILARRFNSMIGTIKDLINREYKLEIANKNNQLRAMQAQINPHFLNNALQSIGTLALQSQAPKVYSLINALGKMMRYNMNAHEAIVPFQSELDHARAFLELQKQRFSEQLSVRFDVDPASLAVPVPKMLLQPLIENVFKHGFEPQGGEGEIRIGSWVLPDGWLSVVVEDNGTGMAPDRLAELRRRLARPEPVLSDGREHIGLGNVATRLKLYYNDKAEMTVDSPGSRGFRVDLRLPLEAGLEVAR
jgi:two-component system sensor histidine kinase YesM